jgi:hypothetical protein
VHLSEYIVFMQKIDKLLGEYYAQESLLQSLHDTLLSIKEQKALLPHMYKLHLNLQECYYNINITTSTMEDIVYRMRRLEIELKAVDEQLFPTQIGSLEILNWAHMMAELHSEDLAGKIEQIESDNHAKFKPVDHKFLVMIRDRMKLQEAFDQ